MKMTEADARDMITRFERAADERRAFPSSRHAAAGYDHLMQEMIAALCGYSKGEEDDKDRKVSKDD